MFDLRKWSANSNGWSSSYQLNSSLELKTGFSNWRFYPVQVVFVKD